jgi:hypothetical protein
MPENSSHKVQYSHCGNCARETIGIIYCSACGHVKPEFDSNECLLAGNDCRGKVQMTVDSNDEVVYACEGHISIFEG